MPAILALLLALVLGNGVGSADAIGERREWGQPHPGGVFGQAETAEVSVENFRFCRRACRPDSAAYVRAPGGPVPGSDNPRAVIYMQRGARFTWTDRDSGCDIVDCARHDLRVEDGTAAGRRIGLISVKAGHDRLDWTIPARAEPESIIRYFCARHAALGMTGAFEVLPIRVLSVSYPSLP